MFVLSRNSEESFNELLTPDPGPDPDHLRGRTSHGHIPSCVKIRSIGGTVFLVTRADRHTDKPTNIHKCITLVLVTGNEGIE